MILTPNKFIAPLILLICVLFSMSTTAQDEINNKLHGSCNHITGKCCKGLEVKLGSKDRIPVRKLPDTNRSSTTCSNVSNFVPTYTTGMPTAAQNAFNYALSLMEDMFVASVPITLSVVWEDVPGNVIGFAGAGQWRANLSFHPEPNKWYPEALTNEFRGSQHNPGPDINVTLDSSANWYFGTDGNPPWNQIDLVTVVLHEVSHGLGFTGTANSNGTAINTTVGWLNWPNIYDPFVERSNGTSILSYANNTQSLLNALTSNDLYFNGTYTNGSNGGTPPKLKSDSPYIQGSSYSHLADEFAGETMRSFVVTGDAIHTLDDLGISMMRDMGWNVCYDNCPGQMTVSNGNELNGTQSHQVAFESNGAIQSTQNIDGGINVIYDSQTSIELLSGFEVNSNTDFEIVLNGCGDN